MDSGELEALCREQWPRLVGILSLHTGDARLAEDLAQETLARLCRDWRQVQRLDSPSAWTVRVAINLANSYWRRVRVQRRVETQIEGMAGVEADESDPLSALAVREAVSALPSRQRAALVLRYFGDFSVGEVAQILGCPEGTVKTLTRAAIAALRTQGLVEDQPATIIEHRGPDAR
jgi:RNA polymerase sigma-70 factor (sigma-E family)